MPWHARAGGIWRDITDPSVRVSGVWQPVQQAWVRVSGVWQQFYSRVISVNISSGEANQSVSPSHSFTPNTATVTGGTPAYSYLWQVVSTNGVGSWSISNSTTDTATPSVSGVALGQTAIADIKCTVTDSLAQVGDSNIATYLHEHIP